MNCHLGLYSVLSSTPTICLRFESFSCLDINVKALDCIRNARSGINRTLYLIAVVQVRDVHSVLTLSSEAISCVDLSRKSIRS